MRQLRIGGGGDPKAHFERVDAPNTDRMLKPDRLVLCLEPTHDDSSSAYASSSPPNGTRSSRRLGKR
jgi:hypothetical protein